MLHHGFIADSALNWVGPGIAPALAATRRVVAIDARGHGASGKPHDPAYYGEAKMARDLMLLVDRLGLSSYDLLGYSMGAIVALLVAAQDGRVRRLVTGGIGSGAVELGGVDRRSLPPEELACALEADDPTGIVHEQAAAFRAFADMLGADRKALGAHARVVHREPIAFERIAAPVLVLAGNADPLAVRPELLVQALAGAKLQLLEGDHMSALRDPRLIPALLEFLA